MADPAVGAFVLLALVAPLVLYVLVRAERRDRETMGRADAERVARRDTTDPLREDAPAESADSDAKMIQHAPTEDGTRDADSRRGGRDDGDSRWGRPDDRDG